MCWPWTASPVAAPRRSAVAWSMPVAARPTSSAPGYPDNSEAMFNYLRQEVGEAVSADTLRDFCQRSVEQLAWLERHGVAFEASVPPQKTSYPSDRYYLYYSGNEAVPAYAAQATPAPRGHRAKGPGMSGASLFAPLRASALKLGVRLRSQCEVRQLVVDNHDRVLGVVAWQLPADSRAARRHARLARWVSVLQMYVPALAEVLRKRLRQIEQRHAVRTLIRAEKGLLLSCGGFIFNRELVARHAPQYLAGLPLGSSACDGSGLLLGQSAGASLARMDKISAWRFINPPLAWARGMIVNGLGLRYCNEEVYGATLGHAMVEEQRGKAILILNRALVRQALKQVGPGKVWNFQRLPVLLNLLFNAKRGNSLEQLAERCALPAGNLRQSVAQYSSAARGTSPTRWASRRRCSARWTAAPGMPSTCPMTAACSPARPLTLGGLRVDERSGAVLDLHGAPIAGLYSAGRNAVGVASNLYVSGLSLADCIYSGRRAAAHIAAHAARNPAPSGEQPCNV
nr:FAD-binding protein [Pseudomonas sp. BIGb0427]